MGSIAFMCAINVARFIATPFLYYLNTSEIAQSLKWRTESLTHITSLRFISMAVVKFTEDPSGEYTTVYLPLI